MLPENQHWLAAYILHGEALEQASALVKANGLSATQRLSIYRNNTRFGLVEALRDGYPVLNKLLGTDCFNRLALDYLSQYPPNAGCLLYFGETCAEFIADYPALAGLPYLADIARLEWYWHEAFHAAEATPLQVESLTAIEPDRYPQLSLKLHPAARLLASEFPVLRIWESNQDNFDGDVNIDLDRGGCQVLIFRPEQEVLMFPLQLCEYRFLLALSQGRTLAEAVTEAYANAAAFEVFEVLQRCFSRGLLVGFVG